LQNFDKQYTFAIMTSLVVISAQIRENV